MGHTSMCQFHTGWSHFSRLMVTRDYDGVSTRIDDDLNEYGFVAVEPKNYCHKNIVGQGSSCQKWQLIVHPGLRYLSKYLYV